MSDWRKLVIRNHGLGDWAEFQHRHPEFTGERNALVVGDPSHYGLQLLERSHEGAKVLQKMLEREQYNVLPQMRTKATLDAWRDALTRNPVLWVQMGHGEWDPERKEMFLAYAGTGRLYAEELATYQLKGHPLIHLDTCVTGWTRGSGGGRYDGHSTAALLAGASCVLSSVHPMFDALAGQFSWRLYGKLLQSKRAATVGRALMETRNTMASDYNDNPLAWAMLVLWGNPNVTLRLCDETSKSSSSVAKTRSHGFTVPEGSDAPTDISK